MFVETPEAREIVVAAAWLGGGIVVGYIVYRIVLWRTNRWATLTTWGGDKIVVGAIHDVALVWFTLAGAYGAALSLPMRRGAEDATVKGLVVVVIVSATWVLGRMAGDLVKLYSLRTGGTIGSSSIFITIAKLIVVVVGLLVALSTLGVSITPLLTALGVGGLAVALALQDTLANLFAGLHIVASKKVKIGDYVELDTGHRGYVEDINWRNVSIRELPNNMVIVPNAKLASAILTNYNDPVQEISVLVEVGVAYDSDLERVERVAYEVAAEVMGAVEGGVSAFEPLVRFHTFGDSSIDFTVVLRAKEYTDQFPLVSEFVKRLHRRFNEEGIEIPFPIRTIVAKAAPGG